MATQNIYPELLPNRIRQDPKRSAEVLLYDLLRNNLERRWHVFYSVGWLSPTPNGLPRDGEADFVLAHPTKGVLVLEVKGGRISYDGTKQHWITTDRDDIDYVIDPFGQAMRSKYALIEKLKTSPKLQNTWIYLTHAVVFPRSIKPDQDATPDSPNQIIIDADDLDDIASRIDEILGFYKADERYKEGPQIVSELKRFLAQSVELRHPLSIATREDEREILKLTEEQFSVLNMISSIRRVAVNGCAGSGKTFLAVEKARRLTGEGFRTLLTCFNRGLADHLQHILNGVENLDVYNFHNLCREYAKRANIKMPARGEISEELFYRDVYPEILYEAIDIIPEGKYDAIIVDEGQDFEENWWLALENCLKGGREGIFYVFLDDCQLLYSGRGTLPDDLAPIQLTKNVRNTQTICENLKPYYRGEGGMDAHGPIGRSVEEFVYKDHTELNKQLSQIFHRLMQVERISNMDIVLLTPKSIKRSALGQMSFSGSVSLVPEQPRKGTRDILTQTVHGFKGLERSVVIVAELEEDAFTDDEAKTTLSYVAYSRARTHLILLGTDKIIGRQNDNG
jgi:hypothetical protein